MEDTGAGRCSVIYYCPASAHGLAELHHHASPPAVTLDDERKGSSLKHVYNNVRRLLDEDQGNFEQVFVTSHADKCIETLEVFAKASPTAVLVELDSTAPDGIQHSALSLLRHLNADVQSSRYPQHVMPFVLLAATLTTEPFEDTDAIYESIQLNAGAIDTMRSPLCSEAINQLVGHVREMTRPSAHSLGSGMARALVHHITNRSSPRLASHRPDEVLSAQRKAAVEEAVGKWQFPAHEFDMDELTYGALCMLEHILRKPDLEQYRLPRPQLMTFLLAARREYKHEREVHYHNWRHAVDVTQSLYCFLCDIRLCPPSAARAATQHKEVNPLESLLSPLDALILLVCGVGHDVGHPGVNNAFLVACNHQLAHMYNDKSVLENYHCAAYSQLIRRHWPALGNITRFRSTMISTILATDMQRHFEYMGYLNELKQKVEKSDADLDEWNDKDREHARDLTMALLLKAADISNVARPFDISAQWAKILMNEFSRQGELERELQIPTCLFGGPPNKEDLLAAAQSQKGFMNLFGFPLFRGISEVMPNVSCTIPELENNNNVWEHRITDEKARREAHGDGRRSPRTYGSVTEAEVEEARTRKRESEPAAVPMEAPMTPNSVSSNKRQPSLQPDGTPNRHPANKERYRLQFGVPAAGEDKRASTPVLWPSSLQLSPTGGASRRSSKDVALNQLQDLSAFAQHNLAAAGSRRGSADAGWQMHQNYTGSRRGSKEESLTTILVTSQGSSSPRSVPASPRLGKPASPGISVGVGKRQSITKHAAGAPRHSVPSSTSQTTASVAATTEVSSPSTQRSSLTPTDDDVTPPAQHNNAILDGDTESFAHSNEYPQELDGMHHNSAPAAFPGTPPADEEAVTSVTKASCPQIMPRTASGDSALSALEKRQSDPQIRQSRSRSRLRGLKFWKRRKDPSGIEGASVESNSP
ncbi:putative 3',5'-cyclic phosphodiesterase pde-4 [Fulvia fulva]|uniref:Phosphodiesterase n=1 Tax=Passalora fulva TaxID=5499 RepID=A0A9Q8L7I4_PASFU|nr:putative 3',5'-cyclic phosphodiesterase pde-4 [Fulvia fulva]KAK4635077.1 putative 3',5'-cyclic phosphodiesterase pde-4 [Fulvia fulva]KAK4637535.1 putative 3',5'-cyclic phosphodiesterase pde-4 [Fulvia fulva]UJO12351.1 putative 3',5'-cyclic phosphodiesterase pde-4 [Fulvia fulva]WPV10091.1 putative 3',5'-cyclic phosphodiesterase pde-4 [Fulvia fulva]WPV24110.1 putative 3',5'-cyclic phosphodiesterase pde-4 [Fulvia fulva]